MYIYSTLRVYNEMCMFAAKAVTWNTVQCSTCIDCMSSHHNNMPSLLLFNTSTQKWEMQIMERIWLTINACLHGHHDCSVNPDTWTGSLYSACFP